MILKHGTDSGHLSGLPQAWVVDGVIDAGFDLLNPTTVVVSDLVAQPSGLRKQQRFVEKLIGLYDSCQR